jgi:hypothetical protein
MRLQSNAMMILDYANPSSTRPISALAVVMAVIAPTLLLGCYMVISRWQPGQHSGLFDWIALIASITVGLPFIRKGRRVRPRALLMMVLYVIVQAIWLFGAGVLIGSILEKS